jgi:capsular exopolysaccharide synthesis family protein
MNIIRRFADTVSKVVKKYLPPVYIVRQARGRDGVDGRVIAYVDRYSHIAEQFKILRTNLYALSPDNPIKTVVITSSRAWEGKTITSCNLAASLSMDKEKKTLLIDADLRKPAVHEMFGMAQEPGFADILAGEASLETFISKPAVGDLYIIPAGLVKDDPAVILSQVNIEPVINKLKPKFDYIIFDTPPVLEFTDASVLGSMCDAVIPVVKASATQENALEEAFNMLTEAQAKPKACILTNAYTPLDTHYYFYKYKHAGSSERK